MRRTLQNNYTNSLGSIELPLKTSSDMQLCIRNIVPEALLGTLHHCSQQSMAMLHLVRTVSSLQAAPITLELGLQESATAVVGHSRWVPTKAASFGQLRNIAISYDSVSKFPVMPGKTSEAPDVLGWGREGLIVQQQVHDLHSKLKELGFSYKFVHKLAARKSTAGLDIEELKMRMSRLWDITHASTPEQQKDVARRIYHVPELLNFHPGTLSVKVQELFQQLQQLGLQQSEVQQLISKQPSVLTFRTEALAQKMQEMSQHLHVQPQNILKLWLRNRSMVNISTAGLEHKLRQLGGMLHLQQHEVAKLVATQPVVLVSSLDTVRQRWQALQECMSGWQPEQLGQALVSQGTVLTQRPDLLKYKWRVIQNYAARHQPSRAQLEKTPPLVAALCLLNRSTERIQLLEYILQQQNGISSSRRDSSVKSRSGGSSGTRSRRRVQSRELPSAAATDLAAVTATGREVVVEGMPLLKHVTNCQPTAFLRLVEEHYPGFWEWQKQQLKAQQAEQVGD